MPTRFDEPSHSAHDGRVSSPVGHRHTGLIRTVTATAAAVASADGNMHPDEYRSFVSYMGYSRLRVPALHLVPLFSRHLHHFATDPAGAWAALTPRLERFAGNPWAVVILRMAEHVAHADGAVHAFELQAIRAVGQALDLSPHVRSAVRYS
jgi:tellurite resistance protein